MRETARDSGRRGEEEAVAYLAKKGYSILERNYRYGHGEIDIIARAGDVLVFIEVKRRATRRFGGPEDAVTPWKRAQIRRIAAGYLAERGIEDCECRCDVIAIDALPGRPPVLRHITDAF